MTNKHTELPLKVRRWDGDQWPERRVSITNGDGHGLFVSARYAAIEKAELQAKEIVTSVNYHHRLRDLVDAAVKCHALDELEWRKKARALLAELDNMEDVS